MTTTDDAVPVAADRQRAGHVTAARVLQSEWVKLRSLRSTWSASLVAGVALAALGPLFSVVTAARWEDMTAADRAAIDPTALSLVGFFVAQLAVGATGVLVVTGEYATGTIRSTFAAVPR
nr:hypothetical protein [Micromonospora sp. DSM 115978]